MEVSVDFFDGIPFRGRGPSNVEDDFDSGRDTILALYLWEDEC